MSWDKNTINLSNLVGYIELLKELEIPFTIEARGSVKGMGLNDNDEWDEKNKCPKMKYYLLSKLSVGNLVFIEQMQRTNDCDSDDYIILLKFNKDEVPDNIPLEITESYE